MIDYTGLDREISCTFIDQTNHRRAYSEKIAMSPIGVGFVILFRCLDDQDTCLRELSTPDELSVQKEMHKVLLRT